MILYVVFITSEIINPCRLSESQITYIKEIKLKNLYSVLEIFMKWNDAGVYDFHMLPYAVKGYITDEDEKMIIDAAETEYSGIFIIAWVQVFCTTQLPPPPPPPPPIIYC